NQRRASALRTAGRFIGLLWGVVRKKRRCPSAGRGGASALIHVSPVQKSRFWPFRRSFFSAQNGAKLASNPLNPRLSHGRAEAFRHHRGGFLWPPFAATRLSRRTAETGLYRSRL